VKLLLVEAPYFYGALKTMTRPHFPLGLGYLAAYVRTQGVEVRLLPGPSPAELQTALDDFAPQVVGVSSMTPAFPNALKICQAVKARTGALTVLGGHHATAVGADILAECPEIDLLVYGEGELTLTQLLQAQDQNKPDYATIPGLIHRQPDGRICTNPPRPLIREVDSLPFPARDLVDSQAYGAHRYIDVGRASATMISSRGCPFTCAFCSSHLTMGKGYRPRSAANVMAEIDGLVGSFGVRHIAFEDDTFTLWPDRVREICELLLQRRYDLTWYCLSRVESMTPELARLMRRAGCRLVSFGIESGDPDILTRIRKKISLSQARAAIEACYQAGLRSQCTFILGFPFDTYRTMETTLRFAQELSPTIAIFFCLIPYPGTEMFRYLPDSLKPRTPRDWESFANMIHNDNYLSLVPGLSPQRLAQLTERWHLRFYLRPRQLYRMLRTLRTREEFFSFLASGWGLARKIALNLFPPRGPSPATRDMSS